MEYLDAVVGGAVVFRYNDAPVGGDGEAMHAGGFYAKDERAVGVEDLDAVVGPAVIGHYDAPVGGDGNVGHAVELPLPAAARPIVKVECAVGVEDVDAVGLSLVGHDDAPVWGDGDGSWSG